MVNLSNLTSSYSKDFYLSHFSKSLQLLSQQENCLAYDRAVEPNAQKRTVQLKQFGIKIGIPDNFRTLLRNNGEVWILNPVDYDLIACTARGGRGGRGLYYQFVKRIPNSKHLSLKTFALNQYGVNTSIQPYKFYHLNGILAESSLGRGTISSSFFLKIPPTEHIVEISAGCDCDVKAKDIIGFLETISLL
ncbi:MAG TPA: hypothetical protein V6D19_19045 [Stenomitos sp.]